MTAFILGICSIPLNCVCFIGIILGSLAIIFGIAAADTIDTDPDTYGKPLAIIGIITGSIGLLLGILFLALFPRF